MAASSAKLEEGSVSSGGSQMASSAHDSLALFDAGQSSLAIDVSETGTGSSTFVCVKCGQRLLVSLRNPHKPKECIKDSRSYKSLSDRWAKDRKLKTWFDGLSDESRQAWYVKQQALPVGTKRKFDNLHYGENSVEESFNNTQALDAFITYEDFETEQLLRGKSIPVIQEAFREKVESNRAECMFVRGQWLIPKFKGVVRASGQGTKMEICASRAAEITSSTQFKQLHEGGRKLLDQFAQSCSGAVGAVSESTNAPQILSQPSDMPVSSKPTDSIGTAVAREVMQQERASQMATNYAGEDVMAAAMFVQSCGESSSKKKNIDVDQHKVAVKNAINTLIGRVYKASKTTNEKYAELAKLYSDACKGVDGQDKVVLDQAKAGIDDAKKEVDEHQQNIKSLLESKATDAAACQNVEALEQVKKEAQEGAVHLLKAEKAKKWQSLVTQFKRNMTEAAEAAVAEEGEDEEDVDEMPPVAQHAIAIHCGFGFTGTKSLYEAKIGMKASMCTMEDDEGSFTKLKNSPQWKKQTRALSKHLKTNPAGVDKADDVGQKKIQQILGLDNQLFTRLPVPYEDETWARKLYDVQAFAARRGWMHVGFNPFGAMEARLVMDGKMVILGIELGMVPGESIKPKRAALLNMNIEQLTALVQKSGWVAQLKKQQALLIPTNYVIIIVAEEETMGLRWSCSSDQNDSLRNKMQLDMLIADFPETRSPSVGYTQFSEFLKDV